MRFKIEKAEPLNLFHVRFKDQVDMTTTMLRMQEFYESPKFRDKFFTWDEYVEWFVTRFNKPFDYLTEVGGFNVPGNYVNRFSKGFDLTDKEEEFFLKLNKYTDVEWNEDYYVIVTAGNMSNLQAYMAHEVRHAMFYLIPAYRDAILKVLRTFPTKRFRRKLLNHGYHKSVLEDEIHAYALTGYNSFYEQPIRKLPQELQRLRKALKKVERQFIKKGTITC